MSLAEDFSRLDGDSEGKKRKPNGCCFSCSGRFNGSDNLSLATLSALSKLLQPAADWRRDSAPIYAAHGEFQLFVSLISSAVSVPLGCFVSRWTPRVVKTSAETAVVHRRTKPRGWTCKLFSGCSWTLAGWRKSPLGNTPAWRRSYESF